MSLRTQFKSLLEPELMEGLVDQTISLKIIRYPVGQATEVVESITLGPLPSWFTLYELKLTLWNTKRLADGSRDPLFSPALVFIGIPRAGEGASTTVAAPYYSPVEMIWMNLQGSSSKGRDTLQLVSPLSLMTGKPDSNFVDSAGGQKALGKDNRIRMTLNDVFQLDEGKAIPELHVFLYSDLVDRIPGPRPLGERDVYGRIMPFFPFLNPVSLPSASGVDAITQIITSQADQTASALKQILYLEELLQTLGGEYQLPKLDGIKFLRWVWNKTPEEWEGPAIVFFGVKVTQERPYMRFFPSTGLPLTKIRVKGNQPIPDLPNPNLLLSWKQDKNPDLGKECTFLKLRIQSGESSDDMPLYTTMRVFNDGTADLLILPPKQKRLLDPYSDLQDAPEALDKGLIDTPYIGQLPTLGQADVVFKIRLKREDVIITKSTLQKRLKAFSSIFQEIPPLPDEQPLAMLRYKGVSNFSSEDRIFAFLTQISAHEMVSGEVQEETWAPRVSEEFQIPLDEARRQVVTWIGQKNEYALAVPETKDYILNKNPGVDIAIFAQHPIYNFHMYRAQSFQAYNIIINLLGLLISAPADRFTSRAPAVVAGTVARAELPPPAPVLAPLSPAVDGVPEVEESAVENSGAFFPDDADIPEFMRGAIPQGEENEEGEQEAKDEGEVEQEDEAVFPNDDVPDFIQQTMASRTLAEVPVTEEPVTVAPKTAIPPPPPAPLVAPRTAAEVEEDKKVAEAFKKPTDVKAIKVKKYYIEKLKQADPDLFDYQQKESSERGYVSHCAANESRQPIVLDNDEYREMRSIYDEDDDITFVVYPQDPSPSKFQKRQPTKDENAQGKLDGKLYPNEDNKEIITLVRYGSKTKRINYYLCPRLFCIRDRLLVRYKDFRSSVDRKGSPKPVNSCPFCRGTIIDPSIKDSERDPNMTILQRKTRPGSETERQLYIGFLGNKKNPKGMSLPCCFADPVERFDSNDPEFVRLGLRPGAAQIAEKRQVLLGKPVEAQTVADAIMGKKETVPGESEPAVHFEDEEQTIEPSLQGVTKESYKYEPNYYRVIQGASVKSIVDANRIPLEIITPKQSSPDDPKAGPQVGLLPETLDEYFAQDSTSDKFAGRLEIVRKLKPTARGFLRLAVDNTIVNRSQSLLSALAPFLHWQPTADKVVENVLLPRIPPRQFLQLNAGNLVHEFFNKCEKKQQNDMRTWVSKYVGVDELKSSNIPAIERLMNSYECFKNYLQDPSQRKDLRVLYQALSEPDVLLTRGILFIVLEVSVEDTTIKRGDKSEYKREVKFQRVRCPPYPLSEGQQKADIGFLVHYNEVIHDRYNPEKKMYRNLGWEPLFYVDGNIQTSESRHKPTLVFQRSQEASWPPIVQKRVSEFFYNCITINRGPYTSQFGMDPNALIGAQEIITGVRIQPNGIIRDSYNHLVGMAYRIAGKSDIVAVPVADDGSIHFERRLFLDWDDFQPAPADVIINFYKNNIINTFSQYRGYVPIYLQKSRDTNKIIGVTLQNGISIPSAEPKDPSAVSQMKIVFVDDLEWDINRTIAYDATLRKLAFEHAEEEDDKDGKYMQLQISSMQDEIEDIYQHLRLSFSTWLATAGAGRDIREALLATLKRVDLPLFEKRKRLDILLEDKVTRWLEPREDDEVNEIGFLRVDCLVQGEADCTGRCKWSSDSGSCKIHSPATTRTNGITIQVPRMLYLRLVDELIRYASRREEIFSRHVPRLTIRQEAQRQGDQYIMSEGSPDWNSWWEMLRTDWMTPEKEMSKFFDEQYDPIPLGLPNNDTRTLPESIKEALGSDDPKTDLLVWNPSTKSDMPFFFLRSVLRNHEIASKSEAVLSNSELNEIVKIANVQVLYMPSGKITGSFRKKTPGATDAIIIATIDGTTGWISQKGVYSVKVPLVALPDSLGAYRIM